MNWTRWKESNIRSTAKKCTNARFFHEHFKGAEKAAKRLGILDSLFPNKQVHQTRYTIEQIKSTAKHFKKRSEFQKHNQSMYNAARKFKMIETLFPIKLNRKYTNEELIKVAKSVKSIKEWDEKYPSIQIARKRGIVAKYGPKPLQGTSTQELELLKFLQSLITDFTPKRFANDFEIDCYSPTLKLGVEFNGLYWHSESQKDRNYHLRKTKYFEAQGIRLIHIWEHEWRDRMPQVKNYLMSACGVNQKRIGARKCEFKEIDGALARAFLSAQHIQGAPSVVRLALGVFHEEQLISVATFGTHHRKRDQPEMILNRFACLPGITVQGGLAKLSKMAFEKLGTLKSWADYSKSQARGYVAAGWKIEGTLQVDYFYTDKKANYISKQSRKKSVVNTPAHLTEAQHARMDGLHRIYDCGKIVLTYTRSAK